MNKRHRNKKIKKIICIPTDRQRIIMCAHNSIVRRESKNKENYRINK